MIYLSVSPEDDHFDSDFVDLDFDPALVNCPLLLNHHKLEHVGELLPIIEFL